MQLIIIIITHTQKNRIRITFILITFLITFLITLLKTIYTIYFIIIIF